MNKATENSQERFGAEPFRAKQQLNARQLNHYATMLMVVLTGLVLVQGFALG